MCFPFGREYHSCSGISDLLDAAKIEYFKQNQIFLFCICCCALLHYYRNIRYTLGKYTTISYCQAQAQPQPRWVESASISAEPSTTHPSTKCKWSSLSKVGLVAQLNKFRYFKQSRSSEVGCCHICPRDSCPRRPLSKGTNVQGTVVKGNFGPMRLLSKEAFTIDKHAQIIFFILYWILRY